MIWLFISLILIFGLAYILIINLYLKDTFPPKINLYLSEKLSNNEEPLIYFEIVNPSEKPVTIKDFYFTLYNQRSFKIENPVFQTSQFPATLDHRQGFNLIYKTSDFKKELENDKLDKSSEITIVILDTNKNIITRNFYFNLSKDYPVIDWTR